MSNYSVLKQDINNNIYENQTQQITGTVLNAILNEMTNSLGAGYQFAGVATLGMNPGDPDQRVFYLAGEGIYTNFGGLQVPRGKLGVLKWDFRWTLQTIDGLGGGGANLTGYVSLASTDDLPEEGQPTLGYLCGTNLYLYVGTGGDTKEGKYQNCGSFRGPQGLQGDPGVGIASVTQTTTSTEDEGINVITVTKEDGTQSTFQVRNGSKGSQGIQGPQGVQGEPGRLQARYKQVETLPTASADTVDYIYLVASQTPNVYDMYYTEENQGAYSWKPLGTTAVQLSDYATKAEVSQLQQEVTADISQLEAKVDDLSTGKYYGYYATANDLPDDATVDGFAYVGSGPTYTIYNCEGGVWTSSGITVNQSPIGNEEDIDQNEDGKLQFANRVYNAQQPDGLGYKILRKDATFAEQVTDTNTIYEIRYDFDLGGATVTIPSGIVLQFDGGSITNGTLDLGGDCEVIGRGIRCEIANPPAKDTYLSLYLGDTSNAQHNHAVLQEMIDCGVGIIIDTPDELTISDYLEVKTKLNIVGALRMPKLTFPNSRGFVWTTIGGSTHNRVENLAVVSDGDAFDFVNGGSAQRPNNVYFSTFKDLRVTSNNGNCFFAGNNKSANGDTCCFDNVFDSIYVIAPLGCGFYGMNGNTQRFVKCRSGKCGVSVFYNCAGHFDSFNGTWGTETPTFFKAEGTPSNPQRLVCEFVNCNIESFQSVLFDCRYSDTYLHLSFVGCSFFVTPNSNSVIDFYPMSFFYLNQLVWRNNAIYYYNNAQYDTTHDFWYIGRFQDCSYDVDQEQKVFYSISGSLYNSVMTPISSILGSGIKSSQHYNQSYKRCKNMELGFLRVDTFIKTFRQIDITSTSSPYLQLTSADWREAFVFKHSSSLDVSSTHTITYFGDPGIRNTEIWSKFPGTLIFFVQNGNTNRKISFSPGNSSDGGFITKDGNPVILDPGQYARFSLIYESGVAKYLVEPYEPKNNGVGTTRPTTSLYIGMQFYDITINKPVWYKGGGEWVDATGVTI